MRSRSIRFELALAVLLALSTASFHARQSRQSAEPSSEERLLAAMRSISSHPLLDYVKELASEKYQGRLTGTPTYDAAARWTIDLLSSWEIKPAGDKGTYLQQFPDPYTLVLPGAELSMIIPLANQAAITKPYVYEQDFFPGSTSDSGTITAEVVYVGYGATAPELGYDDYEGVDVKGKIVLMEPEVPVTPDKEPDLFKRWRPYSFHDYKVKNAQGHGAAGMVYNYHIVNPNCVFLKGFLLTYVGRAVVDDIFAGTGRSHDELVKAIQTDRKPVSFATGKVMRVKNVTEHHPEGVGSNVIAYLEGSDRALKAETIIIGAHLDHLGMNDRLMPGANDDASGVAVTLGVAEALATSGIPLRRSVLFILFGAEEQGVKGSEYYVAHPAVPNDRVKGFINLESVGRGERITAGAGGKDYNQLWEYFDRNNRKYIHRPLGMRFSANLARPRQDAAHFMWANVPTLSFGTSGGNRLPFATYHTTRDTPEIITPEIMQDLARLVFLSVVEMANGSVTQ